MKHPKYAHSFEVVSDLPEPLRALKDLAYNFRWTWHHATRELFREVDKSLWEQVGHNPVQLLARLSPERLQWLASDSVFLAKLGHCHRDLQQYLQASTWFDEAYPGEREKTRIAYFCAEFGVSEGLPIYSGGLGVLAGDHLKAASDLGVPLVGIGLLYARGYFRQYLSPDGWQQERYPQYDFYGMPLHLMRGQDEQPVRIEVEFPDRVVTCQVWRADVGRVPLYLLDSNVLENEPNDQSITDTLYGGDEEMRIRQEMILGIGGLRALRAVGAWPTVCHMNEGHAAFLSVERLRQYMQDTGCDYRTARQVNVSGNVFTTHTPVPAGFDLFHPELLSRYMGKMASSVGLTFPEFVKLGRIEPENEGEAFNMAVLAMENANRVNAVSKLHANVTRGMFHQRWPMHPEDEVPIDAITNGIHTQTWISRRMAELLDHYLGHGWREDPAHPEVWEKVWDIPDSELWELRENQRGDFVRFVRKRLQRDLQRRNMGKTDFGIVSGILDPRVLTVGFARRFATYKRATLILSDRERLKSLLFHPERPVQIVFAGKSHPRDDGGKKLIQDLFNFINHEGAGARMVFLEDYDMQVARALVQGVDVWLNNPRRPMEASGTSGMKVVPNGGLNCSVLDGWWDEGFRPGAGWAIGERGENPDQGQQDWLDSRSFYQIMEQEIAPTFYHRVDGGVPSAWIEMVKRSMAELAPQFSTHRMVREYTDRFYMPAAEAFHRMSDEGQDRAKAALAWRDRIRTAWPQVKVVSVGDTAQTVNPLGEDFCIRAAVTLGTLSPEDVRVQALVGQIGPNRDLLNVEVHDLRLTGQDQGAHVFEGSFSCDRPGHRGYTVRVVPRHEDVHIPSEINLVAWES
ncbi:MAG TPA: alpha-glucan family phosphorylase [Fimbriimonadaceae bacterium]|nr:alpha-glucan family phosphorylase [Fimbriimonadaceae bacterium]